ncbi:MAG: urate oxidase [Actinobacteria bacterium]|nr:urate oxidase [Actinomycetota bacterium]
MGFELGPNRYGKAGIHLATVMRGDRDEFYERFVDVRLEGDFGAVHVEGDNASVLPTDTMRSSACALAFDKPDEQLESFALRYAEYLLKASPAASLAEVWMSERPWNRAVIDGTPHPHTFTRGSYQRTAHVLADREDVHLSAGLDEFFLLKTSGSAFSGFLKDRFTILPETDDRILATKVDARWRYARSDVDFAAERDACRDSIVRAFAQHDDSRSVQHTLWYMGTAVLEASPVVEEVAFSLPNLHHVAVDLAYCGRQNDGQVFIVTDNPSGRIEGTVRRTEDASAAPPV